jgi:hypothetical protein
LVMVHPSWVEVTKFADVAVQHTPYFCALQQFCCGAQNIVLHVSIGTQVLRPHLSANHNLLIGGSHASGAETTVRRGSRAFPRGRRTGRPIGPDGRRSREF